VSVTWLAELWLRRLEHGMQAARRSSPIHSVGQNIKPMDLDRSVISCKINQILAVPREVSVGKP